MPECRDEDCICGHQVEMHDARKLCMYASCNCMRYKKCHTGQMFVAKGKQPFTFYISGRGMAPHNMSMSDIKVYLQGLLSHADKNIMDKLYRDMKPRGLIFDMITSVEDYDRL